MLTKTQSGLQRLPLVLTMEVSLPLAPRALRLVVPLVAPRVALRATVRGLITSLVMLALLLLLTGTMAVVVHQGAPRVPQGVLEVAI